MGQFDAGGSKQMGILKEKTLEVQGKEVEAANPMNTPVCYPQSFWKYVDSDSEEPEMDSEDDPEEEPEEDPDGESEEDPEEEPEEDPEEEEEEDLEMEGKFCNEKVALECATPFTFSNGIVSAEQLTEREDEDSAAEFVFEPNSQGETDEVYQNMSDGKQRIVVNKAVQSLLQNYGLGKNRKYDEPSKQGFKIKHAAIGQHCVPGDLEEAVVGNENSKEQANHGKRRLSKWDQGPEDDKKAIIDRECKKGKTMWDVNDSKSTLQEPLHLTDMRSSLCRPLLDVQLLKKRFSEISSILDPLVDDKLQIGVYAPDKLIKEREKIFLELAKRNAIITKELYVPVKEYPTYNFIGLILGPKGNTQKLMELKTGARIWLRGKDFSKSAQEADSSEEEDLNVYIEAVSQKSLDAAVCMVEKLLISVEDEMNVHKRAQLQELGNLKAESYISSCSVCKEPGHNNLACPQKKPTLKAGCETCGSFSHLTSSCPVTPSNLKFKSSKEIDAANLYIGYLPQTVDESRLQELFSPFGTITQSRVTLDRTGYSMGHGFVRFDTPSAASLAIMHMNGYRIDGHRLRVRIAGVPPGQLATSHLPVYTKSGPAAVATSYTSSPHHMVPKAQVSFLNVEGTSLSSSLNMEYSEKISQTEATVIPQNVSGSSESSSAFLSSGLASASTDSSNAFSSAVASSSPTLPDFIMQEPQVSVLNGEGLGYPSTINMDYLTNLYIGFLPQSVDSSRFWELFSPFGTITQLKVALDQTGYSKGYGFVRFDTPSAASLAIMHMNGCEIDGHRLTVKIANTPTVGGQLATNLLHVYPNHGPTAVPTSYPASPYYMMQKAQLSVPSGEGIGFPSSLNLESSNQFSQTEAPVIHQEVSISTVSTTAAGLASKLIESKSASLSTSLVSSSSESSTTYSSIGLVSTASTELGSAYSSTVATSCLALPDYMAPQAQLPVLNGEGLGYPSSLNMEYLSNLRIGFLPQTVDDSRLWELFSPFGTITQLKVVLDRTGYSKGYGFVKFDNPSAASLAIMHMNGYEIDGHRLMVKIADSLPVRAQPVTNLIHVYPNPGPTAVATNYSTSPYYMMQKAQVSVLNGEGLDFPSSLKMESSNQFSQNEAPGPIGQPATSLVPVYSFPGPATVASSCPAVPHYIMPKALQSEGVSGSTGSSAAISSTAFVSRSAEPIGVISGPAESRTSLSSPGLVAASAESRSVISQYSFNSLFCSDSKYPGSKF